MRHFAIAGLSGLVLAASAHAQTPVGKQIIAPSGFLPSGVNYCDDGTGHAVICPSVAIDPAVGAANSTAKPVQNGDGTKLATDTQLVNAVTQLTTATARLTSILAALGAPMQTSGGSVTNYLPQLAAASRSGLFGATAAQLMPANASRHFIQVQVQSTTASCYINGNATATLDQNSLLVASGSLFESSSHVGTGAISIVCTAANTPVFAREG